MNDQGVVPIAVARDYLIQPGSLNIEGPNVGRLFDVFFGEHGEGRAAAWIIALMQFRATGWAPFTVSELASYVIQHIGRSSDLPAASLSSLVQRGFLVRVRGEFSCTQTFVDLAHDLAPRTPPLAGDVYRDDNVLALFQWALKGWDDQNTDRRQLVRALAPDLAHLNALLGLAHLSSNRLQAVQLRFALGEDQPVRQLSDLTAILFVGERTARRYLDDARASLANVALRWLQAIAAN